MDVWGLDDAYKLWHLLRCFREGKPEVDLTDAQKMDDGKKCCAAH
ncbi:hypothetical protein ACVWYJ_005830 [Bradyrhizobium sp. USDA 4471]